MTVRCMKHDTTLFRKDGLERVEAFASQWKGKSCHTTTAFRSRWLAQLTVRRFLPRTPRAGAPKKTRGVRFAVSATLLLLAGCANPFANLHSAGAPPQAAAPLTQQQNGDLLYVVNYANITVSVYSYPAGTRAGTLSGFSHAQGACADFAGHIFIANTGAHDIVEYAHGGDHPQRTLADDNYKPVDCAVSPRTGDLAVVNAQAYKRGKDGSVALYHQARGTPQYYTGLHSYLSCAFDRHGVLFVVGEYGHNYYLEELPKGENAFKEVHFQNPQVLRYIGWDGEDITDEVPETNWSVIYRLKISSRRAHVESVTTVSRRGTAFFDRPRVIVTGQSAVAFFDYPSGSGPTRKFFDYQDPVTSVVSHSA